MARGSTFTSSASGSSSPSFCCCIENVLDMEPEAAGQQFGVRKPLVVQQRIRRQQELEGQQQQVTAAAKESQSVSDLRDQLLTTRALRAELLEQGQADRVELRQLRQQLDLRRQIFRSWRPCSFVLIKHFMSKSGFSSIKSNCTVCWLKVGNYT